MLIDLVVSPKEMEHAQRFGAGVLKLNPDFKGPIPPEESVAMMLNIIDKSGIEKSGIMLSHREDGLWV